MKIMKRIYQFLLLAAGCAALTTACSDDDDSYLVRETDSIRFASCLASSKQITLRCNGSWRTVIPRRRPDGFRPLPPKASAAARSSGSPFRPRTTVPPSAPRPSTSKAAAGNIRSRSRRPTAPSFTARPMSKATSSSRSRPKRASASPTPMPMATKRST